MNFLLHLKQEWDVIKQTPFACMICLVIGFAVGSWYYAGRLAILDNQVSFWKDKATSGSSPSVAVYPPTANSSVSSTTPAANPHFTLNASLDTAYPSQVDGSTGILLNAQIRNSGISSIATAWRLMVTPKGRSPVAARLNFLPSGTLSENPLVVVRSKDGLAAKVEKNSIKSGTLVSGKLLFYVELPLSVVNDPSTKMHLTVQDIEGKEFATDL
jgi:hypothetical protein